MAILLQVVRVAAWSLWQAIINTLLKIKRYFDNGLATGHLYTIFHIVITRERFSADCIVPYMAIIVWRDHVTW